MEIWRQYPHDTRYEVSIFGHCRYIPTGHVRKPIKIKNGYMTFAFSNPRKLRYVHSMVLETFVCDRPEGMTASHLNGDRSDNRLKNLAWETSRQNIKRKRQHGTEPVGENRWSAKLSIDQAIAIKESNESHSVLSKRFSISRGQVHRIKSGKNWSDAITIGASTSE